MPTPGLQRAPLAGRPRASRALLCSGLVGLGLLAASPALAGPWSKGAGHGYAKVGSATFTSKVVYDTDGVARSSDPYTLRAETLYAYAEVGLTDRLTLIGFVPYVFSTNSHRRGFNFHTFSPGDAMAGLQLGILQGGPVAVAARAEAKIPLYQGGPSIEGRQTRVVPGFERTTTSFPAVGDGQVDLTGWLSVGAGLPVLDGFVSVEGGYRYRSGNVTDAFVLNASGGVFLPGRYALLMVNTQRVFSLQVRKGSDEILGKAFWAVGPALILTLWRGLAFEVGADWIFRGQNSAGGVQVLAGLSYGW